MATINFPASPTPGQEYAFGGFIYVWDGIKWTSKVVALGTTYIQETAPPLTAIAGSLWFCTANGIQYILYKDSDSTQWVESNPNVPVANGEVTAENIGAVMKAGDTMTGTLGINVAPGVQESIILTSEKGGGLIRGRNPDASESWYVGMVGATENNVALYNAATGDYVALVADDPTRGACTVITNPHSDSPQGGAASSLTRKDYVDQTFVSAAGDTVNGQLIVDSGTNANPVLMKTGAGSPNYLLAQIGGENHWYIGAGGSGNDDTTFNNYIWGTNLVLRSDRITVNKNIVTDIAQSTLPSAYTRKDYVDASLLEAREALEQRIAALEALVATLTGGS